MEERQPGRNTSGRPIAAKTAAQLLKTTAEAVHFAHQRGTLHRDLKPRTILIDSVGQPRITDFGLAERLDARSDLTESGAIMGSPNYMAPEQATARQDLIGPATDVYGLGVILYEMLTGKKPFEAKTPAMLLGKSHQTGARVAAENHEFPALPADLEIVCLKCLEKQTQRRYASARALAEDLGHFLKHEPICAQPPPFSRKAANWLRRHPWVIVTAVSGAALALLCTIDYLVEQNNYLRFWRGGHPVAAHLARTADGDALASFETSVALIYYLVLLLWIRCQLERKMIQLGYDLLDLPRYNYTIGRGNLQPAWIWTLALSGAVCVALGGLTAMAGVHAAVWRRGEGTAFSTLLVESLAGASCGGMLLWDAVRRKTADTLGLTLTEDVTRPSADQLVSISAAIYANEVAEAIRLYRQATGATARQFRALVFELAAKLHRQHPDKVTFEAPVSFRRALPFIALALLFLTAICSLFPGPPTRRFSWPPPDFATCGLADSTSEKGSCFTW